MNFEKLNVQWSACCTANPENAVRSATSQQQLRFLLIFLPSCGEYTFGSTAVGFAHRYRRYIATISVY